MMIRHTRRGRPRTLRPEIDKGTPELQHKQQQGETLEAMDALRLYLSLAEEELRPAYYFRWLHSLKFGLPYAKTTVFDPFSTHEKNTLSEQERAEKVKEYNLLCKALAERSLLHHFMDITIYNRYPADRNSLIHLSVLFRNALNVLYGLQNRKARKANTIFYKA